MSVSTSSTSGEAPAGGTSRDFVQSAVFAWLSRAGFVARGVIYGIIGMLALKLALGAGGETTDQEGAMRTVASQPLGEALLALLAAGLAGYALWRLTRAALGRGPEGSDSGIDRIGALGSGLVYAGLCLVAVKILLGARSAAANSPDATTSDVLGWPAGRSLVVLAGLVLIGVGAYQLRRGVTRDFLHDSKTEEMRPSVRRWITLIGTVGHLARAVVFGLVGVFLVDAAAEYEPRKAVGLDGALATLQQQSHGQVLLGIVAAGLVAFAAYSVSDARYRRI
jgi:hypothetical protein